MLAHQRATPDPFLHLPAPSPLATVVDPASAPFRAIEGGFDWDRERSRPLNPHVEAVQEPICRWAARHGLADSAQVDKALARARFTVLAGYGHPDSSFEGFLLTAKWCTWLFIQDDWLCDRPDHVMAPEDLAPIHGHLLDTLLGEVPDPEQPLATSIHDIGEQILIWGGMEALERFERTVRGYLWGTRWEALNRIRAEVPSVSAFSKMRPHAGAAYTAFEFWEIVEGFSLTEAEREHVVRDELRLLANNCISWANDLYSLAKEMREGNPNNLVLALARERGTDIASAMRETVAVYNREYEAFRKLAGDLGLLGLAEPGLDLRPYAERLHSWIIGNIQWSRLTPRYREGLTMFAG
jgi:hypothetical protein